MKNIILSRGISDLMNRMMFFFVCSFSVPSSAWLLFLFFAHFFLFIGAQALRGVFQFLSISFNSSVPFNHFIRMGQFFTLHSSLFCVFCDSVISMGTFWEQRIH